MEGCSPEPGATTPGRSLCFRRWPVCLRPARAWLTRCPKFRTVTLPLAIVGPPLAPLPSCRRGAWTGVVEQALLWLDFACV